MALDIRYARNGGVAIAYQVVGDGETDLAYVPDYCSNLVYGWEVRHWREFYERLAQSFRLILFDKRGTGLSDHGGQFTALETLPTLVMYRPALDAERNALEVTDLIPSAHALRVSGSDYGQIHLSPEIPEEVARFVAREEIPEVPDSVLATVLFTDIVGSTEQAAALGDHAWRGLLERHHALVRRELARFRGEERDTAGDGFFATFDGPARAIRCAQALVAGVRDLGLELRAGVHTGECELHDGKVAGLAVSIGARVAATAEASEVLVSQTVKDLVAGTGLVLEDRGERELKGVPGSWRLYRAISE